MEGKYPYLKIEITRRELGIWETGDWKGPVGADQDADGCDCRVKGTKEKGVDDWDGNPEFNCSLWSSPD